MINGTPRDDFFVWDPEKRRWKEDRLILGPRDEMERERYIWDPEKYPSVLPCIRREEAKWIDMDP